MLVELSAWLSVDVLLSACPIAYCTNKLVTAKQCDAKKDVIVMMLQWITWDVSSATLLSDEEIEITIPNIMQGRKVEHAATTTSIPSDITGNSNSNSNINSRTNNDNSNNNGKNNKKSTNWMKDVRISEPSPFTTHYVHGVSNSNTNSNTNTTITTTNSNSNNRIRSSIVITTVMDAIVSVFPQRKRERELQITVDSEPWTLDRALSFSRYENLSKKYTAVTRIQQSAESRDVDRGALLLRSTIDARRTKVK
jgi:hypothetical protein